MATFLLVHGGWAGGWHWREVASLLRAAGHEVFTPTLTGLGERVHLASPDVGLDTHIQDILMVLEYEELRDVILVGYSYSGMVITGVAERAADRLGASRLPGCVCAAGWRVFAGHAGTGRGSISSSKRRRPTVMAGAFRTTRRTRPGARRIPSRPGSSPSHSRTRPRPPCLGRLSTAPKTRTRWGRVGFPSPKPPSVPGPIAAGAIASCRRGTVRGRPCSWELASLLLEVV